MLQGCVECWVFPPVATTRGVNVALRDGHNKMPNYLDASEPSTLKAVAFMVHPVSTLNCAASMVSSALESGWLG